MPYDPNRHHRRSIRLQSYDYAQDGAYFVTICTHDRTCLFGEITEGNIVLSEFGQIAAEEWVQTAARRPAVDLDAWVIMPNHLHGVLLLHADHTVGATRWVARSAADRPTGPAPGSLGAIVSHFKAAVTKRITALHGIPEPPIWQRNYFEHIIRSESELGAIRAYIESNPGRWAEDRENPAHLPPRSEAR